MKAVKIILYLLSLIILFGAVGLTLANFTYTESVMKFFNMKYYYVPSVILAFIQLGLSHLCYFWIFEEVEYMTMKGFQHFIIWSSIAFIANATITCVLIWLATCVTPWLFIVLAAYVVTVMVITARSECQESFLGINSSINGYLDHVGDYYNRVENIQTKINMLK